MINEYNNKEICNTYSYFDEIVSDLSYVCFCKLKKKLKKNNSCIFYKKSMVKTLMVKGLGTYRS